jgi:predicted ATPase
LRGWARTEQGDWDDGVAELRAGLDTYTASGARINLPYFIGLLAEASLASNNHSESLEAAIEARRAITTRGFCHQAELLRLEGVARIELGDEEQGKARLDQALEVARSQKARSLELRIAETIGG